MSRTSTDGHRLFGSLAIHKSHYGRVLLMPRREFALMCEKFSRISDPKLADHRELSRQHGRITTVFNTEEIGLIAAKILRSPVFGLYTTLLDIDQLRLRANPTHTALLSIGTVPHRQIGCPARLRAAADYLPSPPFKLHPGRFRTW